MSQAQQQIGPEPICTWGGISERDLWKKQYLLAISNEYQKLETPF